MAVYIVRTTYRVGIYLSLAAVKQRFPKRQMSIQEYQTYEEAKRILREEISMDLKIPWENFLPNRMYKVWDDSIFTVVYTWKKVGFVKTENLDGFIKKYCAGKYYCKRGLTYSEASRLTWQLGAITGSNKIFASQSPKCGRFYQRYKRN